MFCIDRARVILSKPRPPSGRLRSFDIDRVLGFFDCETRTSNLTNVSNNNLSSILFNSTF